MRYPELVPDWVCTTPISLTIEGEGLDEDGAPSIAFEGELLCNWQDGGKVVFTDREKLIEVSGRAYFNGDIVPNISNIVAGSAEIFGELREINRGYKRRNPDGTVNYTEIQFK
jgi:hypothetical protein